MESIESTMEQLAATDTQIVEAVKRGDREAFGELVTESFRLRAQAGRLLHLQAARDRALTADEQLTENLVRQFGSEAGERRYDSTEAGWDEATKAAARRKVLADAELRGLA